MSEQWILSDEEVETIMAGATSGEFGSKVYTSSDAPQTMNLCVDLRQARRALAAANARNAELFWALEKVDGIALDELKARSWEIAKKLINGAYFSDSPHLGDDAHAFADILLGEFQSVHGAAVQQERDRQEWLWCAALINALGSSDINKVTTTFLGFRKTLGHMSAEQLREFAGEKTHEIAAAIRKGVSDG